MYLTFRNNDEYSKINLLCGGYGYTLEPKSEIELLCFDNKITFEVEFFQQDFSDELKPKGDNPKLKDKVLYKLARKFAENLPKLGLYTKVTYELSGIDNDAVVDLSEGGFSSCTGEISDFFDMMPIAYTFALAETNCGKLSVLDTKLVNRRAYLKLQRRCILFMDWGLILPDLFLFVPKYITVLYFSSEMKVSNIIKALYDLTPSERLMRLNDNNARIEKQSKKSGCFSGVLKVILFFVVLIGLCCWITSGEPDVLMESDFSKVKCFEEVFVRIDGGLPADAKETFLEDYSVYYPDPDGGYDMDSYYCHIYEDSNGDRYMWVKTDLDNLENAGMNYEDCDNPLVFKAEYLVYD